MDVLDRSSLINEYICNLSAAIFPPAALFKKCLSIWKKHAYHFPKKKVKLDLLDFSTINL